ncbi:hypothetical protein Pyrfu_0629 [Pyrolobus fumarii 1A]|uniref:Restriction endonuclease type IV Mrr domain-containing protein n=1 Tax=Pyrolobus fumarii (strain DSM 11204 / 1A) TaxID=694429 RepID=G0EHC3_PYRF1|nr:restriction endonuclease [Pyrolobus fumarii]AEM38498.1 hypothetical protein Pyrfu_0629 [Pyrolobus fumarii 1A]
MYTNTLERLAKLCVEGADDVEKLSAYFTLLFLYHEEGRPSKEETSSFLYNLKEVIQGLGFSENQAKSAIDQLRDILEAYLNFLCNLPWESNKVADKVKAFIENILSSRCVYAAKLHLDKLKAIINNANDNTRRAIIELRNLLIKYANRIYGLKLEATEEAPLALAVGEFKLKELFKVDSAFNVERLLQSMGIGVGYEWSSRRHHYRKFMLFPAFFSLATLDEWSQHVKMSEERSDDEAEFSPSSISDVTSGVIRAREDLEHVVARALRALGFQVWVNVRKAARRGAAIEVDVWAEKRISDTRFKVYVSCKNWNRDVDRSVVDEEFGRVFNLQEVPHLRILVVKSMSRPAKEVAEADGFFVIEVGEKATRSNADEVYKLIYKRLSDIFTSIAPPQLLEIAKRVGETAKELNKIAKELAKLSQSY